jgi:protein SCO1
LSSAYGLTQKIEVLALVRFTDQLFKVTLVFLMVLLLSSAKNVCGADEQLPAHQHSAMAMPAVETAQIGLTERLGEKVPLDLIFRNEDGKPVRLGELITGPTIILPVYYKCTNVCNFLQGGISGVLSAVKRKPVEEYRVLSISFDETETPALASKYKRIYLDAMNAPFPEDGWRFLTGDLDDIHKLTNAIGFHFIRQGAEFVHPVASLVVGRDGTIVRYFYGTSFLPKDITLALLEASEGKVGASIRTVVGYCFSFDPTGKTYVFNLMRVSATVVIFCTGAFLFYLILSGRKRKHPPRGNQKP